MIPSEAPGESKVSKVMIPVLVEPSVQTMPTWVVGAEDGGIEDKAETVVTPRGVTEVIGAVVVEAVNCAIVFVDGVDKTGSELGTEDRRGGLRHAYAVRIDRVVLPGFAVNPSERGWQGRATPGERLSWPGR